MSKSLNRVIKTLSEAGLDSVPLEMHAETRTAQQAAMAAACQLDQIAKSVIFAGQLSGRAVLFITAGGNRVDNRKASAAAGEALGKANAALIRRQTGFAIGGVAPLGHLTPIQAYLDPRLLEFEIVYGAAGTPRHIFPIEPEQLLRLSGAEVIDFTEQRK